MPTQGKKGNSPQKADKQQLLRKLANARVPKVIVLLRLVGNLANYEPTDKQAEVIMQAVDEAWKRAKDKLQHPSRKEPESSFEL